MYIQTYMHKERERERAGGVSTWESRTCGGHWKSAIDEMKRTAAMISVKWSLHDPPHL